MMVQDHADNAVIVSPDYLVYGDRFYGPSQLIFLSDCIKIKCLDTIGCDMYLVSKWAIASLLLIHCHWSQSVGCTFPLLFTECVCILYISSCRRKRSSLLLASSFLRHGGKNAPSLYTLYYGTVHNSARYMADTYAFIALESFLTRAPELQLRYKNWPMHSIFCAVAGVYWQIHPTQIL